MTQGIPDPAYRDLPDPLRAFADTLRAVHTTNQRPFGSFVESEGFTGLAHDQSWPVGARVSVRILAIDQERQRFSLAPV